MIAMASASTARSTPPSGRSCQRTGTGHFSPLQRRLFFFRLRLPVPVREGGDVPPVPSAHTATRSSVVGRGVKWKSRYAATAAASKGGGGREPLPPEAVTFSATISTDVPLYDTPEVKNA